MTVRNKGGRPKKPLSPKELLVKDHLPIDQLFNEEEFKIYKKLVTIYLKDLDQDELNSNDMDDIMNLAINRVMEFRLLKESKDEIGNHLNVSNAIEKLRKHTTTIKENLSVRRKDRIDPDKYKGFSIVDLVAAYDEEQSDKLAERERKLRAEEKVILDKRKDYQGNKDDKDRSVRDA